MPVGKNLKLKRDKIIPEKEKNKDIVDSEEKKVQDIGTKKKEKKKKSLPISNSKKEVKNTSKKTSVKNKNLEKGLKKDKKVQKKVKKADYEAKVAPKSVENIPEVQTDIITSESVPNDEVRETIIEALEERNDKSFHVEIIPSKRKAVKKTKIELSGELTISNSVKINKGIKDVFKDYNIFSIVLKDVDALDLSILQLLYFYKTLCENEGKEVKISAELTNEIKELITVNGFSNLLFSSK